MTTVENVQSTISYLEKELAEFKASDSDLTFFGRASQLARAKRHLNFLERIMPQMLSAGIEVIEVANYGYKYQDRVYYPKKDVTKIGNRWITGGRKHIKFLIKKLQEQGNE